MGRPCGVAAVKASRHDQRLQTAKALIDAIKRLTKSLSEIDRGKWANNHPNAASDQGSVARRSAINALGAIDSFLTLRGINSASLFQLRESLKAVENYGDTPAIFTPSQKAGRKSDSNKVQFVKGWFAGMAYVQMKYGLSRTHAAEWVARNIPAELARRISKKPISPATVKEWMDEFGGNLRVRKRIISEGLTDEEVILETNGYPFVRPEIHSFIQQEIKSKRLNGTHGEHGCLRMLDIGHLYLAARASPPYREIFAGLQERFKTEIPISRKP